MNDLKRAEQESAQEKERASEIEVEVESHKNRLEHLEAAVQSMQDSASDMDSDDLRASIGSAEQAILQTQEKLNELKQEKEDLLSQNQELSSKTKQAHGKRSQALTKLGMAEMMTPGADDGVKSSMQSMSQSLQKDMNRLGQLDGELEEARRKLESLDI
jgi:chromosome segregation ATPase